jgi:hypothetical protein
MTNKLVELGVVIATVLIGFGIANATLDNSTEVFYDAQGEGFGQPSGFDSDTVRQENTDDSRVPTYGTDERGSMTTSMPLNLGGKRSKNKKNKDTKKKDTKKKDTKKKDTKKRK